MGRIDFDQDLEGLVYEGQPIRYPYDQKIIRPPSGMKSLTEWRGFWANEKARLAALSDIYEGIKAGLKAKEGSAYIVTDTLALYTVDGALDRTAIRPFEFEVRPALPRMGRRNFHDFVVQYPEQLKAIFLTSDSPKEIYDNWRNYFSTINPSGLQIEIDFSVTAGVEPKRIVTLKQSKYSPPTILMSSVEAISGDAAGSYGVRV